MGWSKNYILVFGMIGIGFELIEIFLYTADAGFLPQSSEAFLHFISSSRYGWEYMYIVLINARNFQMTQVLKGIWLLPSLFRF